MAEVETGAQAGATTPAAASAEDTFTHQMGDGSVIIIGKPRAVLKMRIRKLLGENHKDAELVNIATMFLSIRSIQGPPMPEFTNDLQFEGFMGRFGSDENLDECLNKFASLMNPEETEIVKTTILEALERGMNDEQTQALLRERTLPLARKRLKVVQDS